MKITEADLRELADHRFSIAVKGDRFKGLDATLMWQYLRFNQTYQEAFSKLKETIQKSKDENVCDHFVQIFCDSWNMSEPLDFNDPIPPKRFYFNRKLVTAITDLNVLRTIAEWEWDPHSPNLLLMVNPYSDQKLILNQIKALLAKYDQRQSPRGPKGSSHGHFADNFICFYLSRVENLQTKDVKTRYRDIYPGGNLQSNQITRKIAGFERNSKLAPWCFFTAPG
jgi:hypothetical protein